MQTVRSMVEELKSIASQFGLRGEILQLYPFGSGHINDTYKLETSEAHYLFQRVNHSIFKDVDGLTRNIIAVTQHLRSKSPAGSGRMQVLNCVPALEGNYCIRDGQAN